MAMIGNGHDLIVSHPMHLQPFIKTTGQMSKCSYLFGLARPLQSSGSKYEESHRHFEFEHKHDRQIAQWHAGVSTSVTHCVSAHNHACVALTTPR